MNLEAQIDRIICKEKKKYRIIKIISAKETKYMVQQRHLKFWWKNSFLLHEFSYEEAKKKLEFLISKTLPEYIEEIPFPKIDISKENILRNLKQELKI